MTNSVAHAGLKVLCNFVMTVAFLTTCVLGLMLTNHYSPETGDGIVASVIAFGCALIGRCVLAAADTPNS